MSLYCNNIKIKKLYEENKKLKRLIINLKTVVYRSNILVHILFKTPKANDKLNNSVLREYDGDSDVKLSDIVSSAVEQIPYNRYEVSKYTDVNGKEIKLQDIISNEMTIYANATYGKASIEFVPSSHVKFPSNYLATYGSYIDIPVPTYDTGYEANGGLQIEELVINADGKSESWIKSSPTVNIIDGKQKYLVNNPMKFSQAAKTKVYIVTFEPNGHGNKTTSNISYGNKVAKPTDPKTTGYTFGGWYTDSKCTVPYDFNKIITANVTLYAKWTIMQFTVTFKNNGITGPDKVAPVKVNYGSKVAKPANIVEQGSTPRDWYYDSEKTKLYDFNTPVTSDLTLYAKWGFLCKISFSPNINNNSSIVETRYVWGNDAIGKLPTCSRSDTHQMTDKNAYFYCNYNYTNSPAQKMVSYEYCEYASYVMDGWYTEKNTNYWKSSKKKGTKITSDYKIPNKTPNTFYACWVYSDTRTAKFVKMGSISPSRAGYTFLGWYTEKTGGTKIELKTGNVKPFDPPLYLYAHWKKN